MLRQSATPSVRHLRLFAALLVVIGAAACAPASALASYDAEEPSEVTASEEEQQTGGRLVVAIEAESPGFDPVHSNIGPGGITVVSAIFDPLMVQDVGGEIVPYLAESMEPNDDFTSWTMRLRPGVVFHDGTPLDAAAVKGHADDALASPVAFTYAGLETVTVVDDLTVRWDLSMPWVRFPAYLAGSLGMVRAPSMLADPDGAAHPVGAGAFVFEDWTPNERLTATRFEDYWRADEGLPYLDEVEFRPIPVFQSAFDALQSGQVDLISGSGGAALQDVEAVGDDIQTHQVEDGAFLEEYIVLNNSMAPFDNANARRALSYATDRDEIIEVLHRGIGEPATTPFSGEDQYPAPANFPGYDPAAAQEALAAYEAETGEPLRFALTTPSIPQALQAAELLQAMWSRVGIDVEIQQIEPSQIGLKVITGDYQAAPWGWDGYPDPDQETPFWTTPDPGLPASYNFSRFSNPDVDELMLQARGTVDAEERQALYGEVAQIIVDEVPWVYTTVALTFFAAGSDVRGVGTFPLPDGGTGVEIVKAVARVATISVVRP